MTYTSHVTYHLNYEGVLEIFLLILKSWYRIVSICCTYDYNELICLLRHSMAIELEDRGKLISSCPIFYSIQENT